MGVGNSIHLEMCPTLLSTTAQYIRNICINHYVFLRETLFKGVIYTPRKKVKKKLSLGLYLSKRYTFVPEGCLLVP